MKVDIKMTDITISNETVDGIVKATMFQLYEDLLQSIDKLNELKTLKDYQKEDLEYDKNLLEATKTMIKHYTPYQDLSEELKNEE